MKTSDNEIVLTYIPGHSNTFWVWNCGWFCYSENKVNGLKLKVSKTPIGHLAFRKLQKTFPTKKEYVPTASTTVLGRRAWSQDWRRWITHEISGCPTVYYHKLFGEVIVLASDGIHAIVKTGDNGVYETMFHNLQEIKPTTSSPHRPTKEKQVKEKASNLSKKQLDALDFLDDLLSSDEVSTTDINSKFSFLDDEVEF